MCCSCLLFYFFKMKIANDLSNILLLKSLTFIYYFFLSVLLNTLKKRSKCKSKLHILLKIMINESSIYHINRIKDYNTTFEIVLLFLKSTSDFAP